MLTLKIDVTLTITDNAILIIPVTVQYCAKDYDGSINLTFYGLEIKKQIGAYLKNKARDAGDRISMGKIFRKSEKPSKKHLTRNLRNIVWTSSIPKPLILNLARK
ncbi:MAG: hypothetical protein U9O20_03520 [Patescibacteria group bacterium]|nr:hypothetical protein [Patescibacteria group bacterium]